MKNKLKVRLSAHIFVCEHKDTTIFEIQEIIIYLSPKYQNYYCVRTQKQTIKQKRRNRWKESE